MISIQLPSIHRFLVLVASAAALSASSFSQASEILVKKTDDFRRLTRNIQPGDVVILERGEWADARIHLHAEGSESKPVLIRAEVPGETVLSGKSEVRISGRHVIVDGIVFTDPKGVSDLVAFRTDSRRLANDCVLRNCSVTDSGPVNQELSSRWVSIYGARNRVENCLFSGKRDVGATLVVWVGDVPGEHRIRRNWFGPRKPLGKNGGETIRVGTSD
ncbi:Chondroitinase-B precursor [Caulifigura coniformis]|uniref:Chondroitinase-B n=1 Tax=Caulifigura coniformis TaxID=2527983 RepID=A0A517SDY5_9PLAN|nr:Chondroitinase-B precursor [Caulifigura coniformis]